MVVISCVALFVTATNDQIFSVPVVLTLMCTRPAFASCG
jgi:hypothetical protein